MMKLLSLLYGPVTHGVWRVDPLNTFDTDAIRERGWIADVVQMLDVTTKDATMQRIARDLNLPAHFGHNWDALWDCLTDNHHSPAAPQVIIIRQVQQLMAADSATAETLASLLDDVSVERSGSRRPLSVLWEGDAPTSIPPLP